jgi:MFS family permease
MQSNIGERWLILAVLFLARTAMGFQFQAVAALPSSVIADFGIDYTQLGLLIGLYLFPGIVIAYPGGLLGQYFGDKRTTIFGLALMVAGGVLTATGQYPLVLAGRLIGGVGAVLLNVLVTKMIMDWFADREIGTALAVLVASWPIGIGIALIVLPWVAAHSSAAAGFACTAGVAAVVLVLVVALYRVPPAAIGPRPLNGKTPSRLSPNEFGLVSLAGSVWMLFNVGYILVVSYGPTLLVSNGSSAGERRFHHKPGGLGADYHGPARRRGDRPDWLCNRADGLPASSFLASAPCSCQQRLRPHSWRSSAWSPVCQSAP